MAFNLMELVQGQLGSGVVKQISGLLGESEANTKSAIGAAIPSLIGGLIKQTSTPSGASALGASLDKLDTGFLGNLTGALSGGGHSKLLDLGGGLLKNLLGSSLGSITDVISKVSGMGKAGLGSLLGLLAPIVMGVLSKHKQATGTDINGLTSLLNSQKSLIAGALPAGVGDALGLGNLMASAGQAVRGGAKAVSHAGHAAASQGSSALKKLIPVVAIAALGFLAWKLMSNPDKGAEVKAADVAQVQDMTVKADSVFTNAKKALKGITDVDTAKAALPQLQQAVTDVNGMLSGFTSLPGPIKDGISKVVGTSLPGLKTVVDAVSKIPGVGDVISPTVTSLMEALGKLKV